MDDSHGGKSGWVGECNKPVMRFVKVVVALEMEIEMAMVMVMVKVIIGTAMN